MLMVLSQLSGDLQILDEVAPHIHGAWSFLESVPEDLKQKVRDRLAAVLKDYAATGSHAIIRSIAAYDDLIPICHILWSY